MKKSLFNSLKTVAMSFAAAALCAVFTAQSSSSVYAQVPEQDYSEGIDKGIEKIMKDLDVVGLGVAVVKNGEIIFIIRAIVEISCFRSLRAWLNLAQKFFCRKLTENIAVSFRERLYKFTGIFARIIFDSQ